jgi:hypothetical protein
LIAFLTSWHETGLFLMKVSLYIEHRVLNTKCSYREPGKQGYKPSQGRETPWRVPEGDMQLGRLEKP